MISTTWSAAPAGLLGLGGSDARPYAVQGTAVPFGCDVDGLTGTTRPRTAERQAFLPAGARRVHGGLVEDLVMEDLVVEVHVAQKFIAPTTGTTLGIPSSSRPPS